MLDPATLAVLAPLEALGELATAPVSSVAGLGEPGSGDVLGALAQTDAGTTTGANATTHAPGAESDGWLDFTWLQSLVETATGWVGLGIIAVYSFLIAVVLPLPSEVVLVAPLNLGLPSWVELALIMLVSGVGKAFGSVFAFHIGQEAKESGPVIEFLRRSRFDVVEWSENKTVEIAQKWGYVGLALALCVPGFPDTLSIYAFSVLEEDYLKFALATLFGSIGRLLVWVAGAEAVLAVI